MAKMISPIEPFALGFALLIRFLASWLQDKINTEVKTNNKV
jgi:hypothetical protein